MLWTLVIATIIGFLASVSIAEFAQLQLLALPVTIKDWQKFSFVSIAIVIISLLVQRYIIQNLSIYQSVIIKFLTILFIFFITLIASCSYGIYHYFVYQQTLIKQPVTVNATIRPLQISDTISDTVNSENDTIDIGNGYSRHAWQLLSIDDENLSKNFKLPVNILVTANTAKNPDWQLPLNQLQPNQQIMVKLALQPIQQQLEKLPVNAKTLDIGFDEKLWLRQRQIQAKAQLISIDSDTISLSKENNTLQKIEQVRWQLRQNLQQSLYENLRNSHENSANSTNESIANYAILLGLLTGDKALMNSELKNLYQVTGISHLLAISGPHVLMLASMVSFWVVLLIKLCLPKLLRYLPSQLCVLWVSVVVAGFYALLVGFEIPAQRTFFMLLLLTFSKQLLININIYRLLAMVGLLMMWLDTTAVMQAGFWLSFVAVALLVKFSEITDNSMNADNFIDEIRQQSWQLFKLQLWLFVLMMPMVVWFFGKISLLSVLVNLFAVPFLGLVIVPLDMLAGILSLMPMVGEWLGGAVWSLLAWSLGIFHAVLVWLLNAGFAKQLFISLYASQLWLFALVAVVLASRGVLSKWLLVPLLATVVVVGVGFREKTEQKPMLVVLQQSRISIQLFIAGKHTWLILSDNEILEKTQKSTSYHHATLVNQHIQPLLAKYQINRLTGVIAQTPSPLLNNIVQDLANHVMIQQYWLAGANPLKPLTDIDNQPLKYDKISPKNCQVGQNWQISDITVKAVTGWQLDLSSEQLSDSQRLPMQTCFIQINKQFSHKNYQALISAGRSRLPMQMSDKLCLIEPVNLLINPYQMHVEQTWLQILQPNIIHVLTGRYDSQHLTESSEFALLNLKMANKNQAVDIVQADKVGDVVYHFD